MSGDHIISSSLILAVQEGNLERVRELIDSFGLSYSQAWSEGYVLLCDAVVYKHTEVAKLLLTNGSRVKSRNKTPTDTPLHYAAVNGDTEIVEMLLNRGANINAKNWCGITPLHNAVKSKKMEITEYLLKRGAYVNARNSYNVTPLHFAVEKGSEEIVRLLLKHGAYVNSGCNSTFWTGHTSVQFGVKETSTPWEGYTPLWLAVKKGHEEVVKLLLESGANVNAQDKDGKTVLHCAVENKEEKVVQLLLECGANVDVQDKYGKTVLHRAVEEGCSVIIEHLLKRCPDVNNKSNRSALNVAVRGIGREYGKIIENLLQYGFTVSPEHTNNCELLHAAVEKGYLKTVEEHLKYGIDVNKLYKSKYGIHYMPLHFATKNKQEEVAKLLISYGADVNAQDETGKPPIFYAVLNADLKITKLLLTNKANIKDNPKLLNIAVWSECRETVQVLLEHGADVNTRDECGRTALHFTAIGENEELFRLCRSKNPNVKGEIAKLLLSRGANVNAQTEKGTTTLHAASGQGYVKLVEALLQYNADVNTKFKNDVTPLHTATYNGHIEIVKVLLKFGANVDSKDKCGRTALYWASKKGQKQIVTALLEHGADINVTTEKNRTPLDYAIHSPYSRVNRHASNDEDGYLLSHEIIADILKRHVVKMKTANLFVNKRYLQSVSRNGELSVFQKQCEEEIASMKSEKVGNANVSFYDILTKGISQLAMYAGNESIVKILRSDDYKIRFPIYASMIKCNFRKGERKKELLEQGNKIFHSLLNDFPLLPRVCIEKIFSYLSDEDLRILIGDCKTIRKEQPGHAADHSPPI